MKLYVIRFRKAATRQHVEQIRDLILSEGGKIRELAVMPYEITANAKDTTIRFIETLDIIKKIE